MPSRRRISIINHALPAELLSIFVLHPFATVVRSFDFHAQKWLASFVQCVSRASSVAQSIAGRGIGMRIACRLPPVVRVRVCL